MLVIRIYFKVLDSSASFNFQCTFISLLWQDVFDYRLLGLKKVPTPQLNKYTIIMTFRKELNYIWFIFLNNNIIQSYSEHF